MAILHAVLARSVLFVLLAISFLTLPGPAQSAASEEESSTTMPLDPDDDDGTGEDVAPAASDRDPVSALYYVASTGHRSPET